MEFVFFDEHLPCNGERPCKAACDARMRLYVADEHAFLEIRCREGHDSFDLTTRLSRPVMRNLSLALDNMAVAIHEAGD